MIKTFENILISGNNEGEIEEVYKTAKKGMKELADFFKIFPEIRIQIVYSSEEFAFYKGFHKPWLVGNTIKNNIWIFSKSSIKKHTIHEENSFETVLKHELGHVFINNLSYAVPLWLSEGLCVYLSEDIHKKNENINKNKLPSDLSQNNKDEKLLNELYYNISPCFVPHLIQCFGKEKLIDYMKNMKFFTPHKEISKKIFDKEINEIYLSWRNETISD